MTGDLPDSFGYCCIERLDDVLDFHIADYEWRADLDVVAVLAEIHQWNAGRQDDAGLTHAVYQACGKAGFLREWLTSRSVGNELDTDQKPSPTNLANRFMFLGKACQSRAELLAGNSWPLEKILLLHDLEDLQSDEA